MSRKTRQNRTSPQRPAQKKPGSAGGKRALRYSPKPIKRLGGSNGGGDSLFIYGQHAVAAALENSNRIKIKLLGTQNGMARLSDKNLSGIELVVTDTASLDTLVGRDAVHQGLVLQCQPLDALDASELFHLADAPLLLVLDQITDPHNVGAILRSAVAFGVSAVLLTHRNSAIETGVLAKSASGALDRVRIINIRNLSKAITELNDMGFATIGLDSEGPLILEESLAQSAPEQIALVLGSEGKGLRQQTRETCNHLARLDMPGPIKSLNVSNAAVLSLYVAHAALKAKINR